MNPILILFAPFSVLFSHLNRYLSSAAVVGCFSLLSFSFPSKPCFVFLIWLAYSKGVYVGTMYTWIFRIYIFRFEFTFYVLIQVFIQFIHRFTHLLPQNVKSNAECRIPNADTFEMEYSRPWHAFCIKRIYFRILKQNSCGCDIQCIANTPSNRNLNISKLNSSNWKLENWITE